MPTHLPKDTDLFLDEWEKTSGTSLNLKDWFYLCLSQWYWFVLSVGVVLGLTVAYLLTTPPVYTRSASLLIKEESKGNSLTDATGVLGNMDLFQTHTNVNNEMQALQSPSVMYDVVKRLQLHVNYTTDGRFYREVLYSSSCPYTVDFIDLPDNQGVSFTAYPVPGHKGVQLTEFVYREGEEEMESDEKVYALFNDTVATPAGRVCIQPMSTDSLLLDQPVYVSRVGLLEAVNAYVSRLTVSLNDEKSTVVNLAFEDVCIQRAEDVLNTVIAVYNENWVKDKNQIAVSTSMFINERLGVIEQELGHVDENISTYKSENLLPDVQAAASMYMMQSNETSSQILALNTQLTMTRYIRNYLTGNTTQNQLLPANSGIESSGIENQIAEYNAMQLRRNDLVANSSEKNPLVIDMDQSLQNMRRAIISSIDNHIVTLNTQLRTLKQSEQQTTARIAANPNQGKYLLSVERQQKVKEALYLFLLQKREENELSQAFTAYNTRVIMPPTGSMAPTAPASKKYLLAALAFGFFLPVACIFVRENLNTKVRGRKDLETLSLPFVGEIPLASDRKKKKDAAPHPIVIQPGSRNVINEAFRVLRTNLEFMIDTNREGKAGVMLFTSFNPGSGKTFLTINTATSFALKGKRVLVIDGDLRRASLSHYIDNPQKGLSNYLGKQEDHPEPLIRTMPDHPNLHILPVGPLPPNPTELLAEDRFGTLLEKMRTAYDCIFIDCPPIDIVADTQIIEKLADRTLFVVRAGLLERDMLPELQRAYEEKRYKNMAVILNGTESGGNRYGYRYGYKYGYHYGYGSQNYYNN